MSSKTFNILLSGGATNLGRLVVKSANDLKIKDKMISKNRFIIIGDFDDKLQLETLQETYPNVIHSLHLLNNSYSKFTDFKINKIIADTNSSISIVFTDFQKPNKLLEKEIIKETVHSNTSLIKVSPHHHLHKFIDKSIDLIHKNNNYNKPLNKFIHLRIHPMMQELFINTSYIKRMICGRRIYLPMKNAKISMIHEKDVADSIISLIIKMISKESLENIIHNHDNMCLLTGPVALSWNEIADLFSKVLNDIVRFSSVPMWAFHPSLWISGLTPDEINYAIETSKIYENYGAQEITSSVNLLTNRYPLMLQNFIMENKSSWPSSIRSK